MKNQFRDYNWSNTEQSMKSLEFVILRNGLTRHLEFNCNLSFCNVIKVESTRNISFRTEEDKFIWT